MLSVYGWRNNVISIFILQILTVNGKMPPNPRISTTRAIEILKKYAVHFESGELPPYSHEVWKNLETEENGAWSHHNWYNKLKQNINELWTIFTGLLPVDSMQNSSLNSTIESNIEENNNTLHVSDGGDNEGELWFDCYLQQEEWLKFNPITMSNLTEKIQCKIPPDDWDYEVDTAFWKQNRLPCVFSFVGAEIDTSNKKFLKLSGRCKSTKCSNKLYAYADIKPSANNDELHLHIRTSDTRQTYHEDMSRSLDNCRKRRFEKKVTHADTCNPIKIKRRKQVPVSSHDAARVKNNENSDKQITEDPIQNIYKMQFTRDLLGAVHDISYSPFYVHYGHSAQTILYKSYSGSRRTATISISRSSNCCKEIIRPKGLPSAPVSLYAIAISWDHSIFAIYQMLAEDVEPEVLEFWLKRWIRLTRSTPKQVIVPYCQNMLSACAEGFNNVTIDCYVQDVFIRLMRGEEFARDKTILKIDPKELAQQVLQWKSLQSVDSRDVRQFYAKSVAVLATSQTLEEFKEIFSLIIIVASQNYDDSIPHLDFVCTTQEARKKLQDLFLKEYSYMKGYWDVINDQNMLDVSYPDVEDPNLISTPEIIDKVVYNLRMGDDLLKSDLSLNDSKSTVIETFIQNLVASAVLTTHTGNKLNAYFLPGIMIDLFRLGKQFPLWTAVAMPPLFLNNLQNHARSYLQDFAGKILESHQNSPDVDAFLQYHLKDLSEYRSSIPTSVSPVVRKNRAEEQPSKNHANSKKYEADDLPPVPDLPADSASPKYSDAPQPPSNSDSYCSPPPQPTEIISEDNPSLDPSISAIDVSNYGHLADKNVGKELNKVLHCKPLRSKFFRDLPEVHLINELNSRATQVFFLRNGNTSPAIVVDGRKFNIRNTCAFDSITRILITSALDCPNYRRFVQTSEDPLMDFVKSCISNATKNEVWQKRARILSPHYKWNEFELNGRIILTEIDAWDSVAQVWTKSISSEPSAFSVLECQQCEEQVNPRHLLCPNHHIICRDGFKHLEKALQFNSLLFNVTCQTCKIGATLKTVPNRHLYLELDIRTGKNNTTTKKCRLEAFPGNICLNMKEMTSSQKITLTKQEYRYV